MIFNVITTVSTYIYSILNMYFIINYKILGNYLQIYIYIYL